MKRIGMTGRMLGLATAALLMVVAPTLAQDRGGRGHDGRKGHMKRAFAQLDLNEEQREQIREIHESFREQNEGARDEMHKLHEQMREQAKNGDREGAKATRAELQQMRAAMQQKVEGLQERVNAVLTPDQQAKLAEMKAKHGERHDARKKRQKCHGKKGDLLEKLELTDDQKEKIEAIRTDFREENADEMAAIKELKEKAKEQVKAGDREGARATMKEAREIGTAMRADKKEMREDIAALLTDDQRALMQEHEEKIRACRGEKKDRKREGRRDGVRGEREFRGDVDAAEIGLDEVFAPEID